MTDGMEIVLGLIGTVFTGRAIKTHTSRFQLAPSGLKN